MHVLADITKVTQNMPHPSPIFVYRRKVFEDDDDERRRLLSSSVMEESASQLTVSLERFRSLLKSVRPSTDEIAQRVDEVFDCLVATVKYLPDRHDGTDTNQEDDPIVKSCCNIIWSSFNTITQCRGVVPEKIIPAILSTLPVLQTDRSRDLMLQMLVRSMSSFLNGSNSRADPIVEKNQLERRIIHELISLTLVDNPSPWFSSVLRTLKSISFYAWASISDIFDYFMIIMPNTSLEDWVPLSRAITHFLILCDDVEMKTTNPIEVLEKVKQVLLAWRKNWLVVEYTQSSTSSTEKLNLHLNRDSKRTYTTVCESISSSIMRSDLVSKGYLCILETLFIHNVVNLTNRVESTPWSVLDVTALITLYSRCGKHFDDTKQFIQNLYLLEQLPLRYITIFAALLLHRTNETAVDVDRPAKNNHVFCVDMSNHIFQDQISSLLLELIHYLLVLPTKLSHLRRRFFVDNLKYTRDIQRLIVKIFQGYDRKRRQDLLNILISLSSSTELEEIFLSKVSEDDDLSTERRSGTECVKWQQELSAMLDRIMSAPSWAVPWLQFVSHSSAITQDTESLHYITSIYEMALAVYAALSTLINKDLLDDHVKLILSDRKPTAPKIGSSHCHAVLDYYKYLLIQSQCSILVSIITKDSSSTEKNRTTGLMHYWRSLAYSAPLTGTISTPLFCNQETSGRIVGLILARMIVHHSDIESKAKDETIRWVIRFSEQCLECVLLHLKPLYWVIIFLSSFTRDNIDHLRLFPTSSLSKRTYDGFLTKREVFRLLKAIMTQVNLVRKISDWTSTHTTSKLRFVDIPVDVLRGASIESDSRMVLCILELSKQFHFLHIQNQIPLDDLSWWQRFIYALTYSYLQVGREVSSLEWSPDSWVLAALESPCYTHDTDLSGNQFECDDVTRNRYAQSLHSISFTVLSYGAYVAILENLYKHRETLIATGQEQRNKCRHILLLMEFQLLKIYELNDNCHDDLKILSEMYDDLDDPTFLNVQQPVEPIKGRNMELQLNIKILSKIFMETYYGDIIWNDESLWKYLLLISTPTDEEQVHDVDDPDQFIIKWNLTMGRSISLRTSITRHIIQRMEFRRAGNTMKRTPNDIDMNGFDSRVMCLAHTLDVFLPIIPQLRQIDIYGNGSRNTSPLRCSYYLVIATAELLIAIFKYEDRRRLFPFEKLFNRMITLAGFCEDPTCSSLLLDLASIICNNTKHTNREELEYASWDDLVAFLTFPLNDIIDLSVTTSVPNSFTAAINNHINHLIFRKTPPKSCYSCLRDLLQLCSKQLLDHDFVILRNKLLLYWGLMNGSGEKLYENFSTLIRRLYSVNLEPNAQFMINTKYLAPKSLLLFHELLLLMALASFALAEPTIENLNMKQQCYPYQHIENYLQLFSSLISSSMDCCFSFMDSRFRAFTIKKFQVMLQLCDEKIEQCIQWRLKQLHIPVTGRRSSQSDPAALYHLGRLLHIMMTMCVCKIDAVSLKFRQCATEGQHDSTDMKNISGSLKKLEKLSGSIQRLSDRIQLVCIEHNLLPSTLETVAAPINQIYIKQGNHRKTKNKRRRSLTSSMGKGYSHEKNESIRISSSSSLADSSGSALMKADEHTEISLSSSESDDSFGVVGRWGRE